MSIKKVALQKAIAMLQAAGAKYKIIDENGEEHCNFDEKKTRTYKYPFGALSKHFKPFVENMEPGDLVEVPSATFDLLSMQSAIAGWFCNNHGNGSCMTSINRPKNVVEVIRVS